MIGSGKWSSSGIHGDLDLRFSCGLFIICMVKNWVSSMSALLLVELNSELRRSLLPPVMRTISMFIPNYWQAVPCRTAAHSGCHLCHGEWCGQLPSFSLMNPSYVRGDGVSLTGMKAVSLKDFQYCWRRKESMQTFLKSCNNTPVNLQMSVSIIKIRSKI